MYIHVFRYSSKFVHIVIFYLK